ncbi:MAG: dihydropteroate synthase [Candidatus Latescibacterota bacterium]
MIWRLGDRVLDFRARVQVMGILNVTPDSFYDGGRYADPGAAVEQALRLVEEGADLIDVGGESSRPPVYGQAATVPVAEECRRVLPVIEGIRRQSPIPLSIDTVKAEVAARALDLGADVVNDISALRDDPGMLAVVAAAGVPVILMHRRGSPTTMQQDTHYDDLLAEVRRFLEERVAVARAGGVAEGRIAVDPGLGFGKSPEGNLQLVRELGFLAPLDCPVLVGASRKSFIWKTLGLSPAEGLEGSLAVAALCVAGGAHLLRVHDVRATVRVVRMAEAVVRPAPAPEDGRQVPR